MVCSESLYFNTFKTIFFLFFDDESSQSECENKSNCKILKDQQIMLHVKITDCDYRFQRNM